MSLTGLLTLGRGAPLDKYEHMCYSR